MTSLYDPLRPRESRRLCREVQKQSFEYTPTLIRSVQSRRPEVEC